MSAESKDVKEPMLESSPLNPGLLFHWMEWCPGNKDPYLLAREYKLVFGRGGINILFASYGISTGPESMMVRGEIVDKTAHVRNLLEQTNTLKTEDGIEYEEFVLPINNTLSGIGGGQDPKPRWSKYGFVWYSTGRGDIQLSCTPENSFCTITCPVSVASLPEVNASVFSNRI